MLISNNYSDYIPDENPATYNHSHVVTSQIKRDITHWLYQNERAM